MESGWIQQNVATLTNRDGTPMYTQAYIDQGLADLWHSFVRDQHYTVQVRVRRFVQQYAQQMYDINRNSPNAVLVTMMENVLNEANALADWQIPWGTT